jgi:hypothetical protein
MTRPSPAQIHAEMASLAAAFSWTPDTLLDLEHIDRRRWLAHAPAGQAAP